MQKMDAILVLGTGINQDGSLLMRAKARVEKAVQLYKKGVAEYVIFCGKWSYKSKVTFPKTEAQAMADYATELGVDKKAIILEQESVDSLTNLLYGKKLVQEHWWKRICVVSSVEHVNRVKYLVEKIFGPEFLVTMESAESAMSKEELQARARKELVSLEISKALLDGVNNGDDEKVWEIVRKVHPAYSKTPFMTTEELTRLQNDIKNEG